MKGFVTLLACVLACAGTALAQPNVRAHYAHGQVWVVWDVQDVVVTNCVPTLTPALSNGVPIVVSNCLPATYAIYWSENPVTNTATAMLVGRLFAQEWSAAILRNNNVKSSFRVPPGMLVEGELGAETEFEKYRITQDQLFRSDFDRFLELEPGS